jgi:hypothetical protein
MITPPIPRIPITSVQARIDRFWNPAERGVHHVLIGPSGSGKSYLIRHGILPVRPHARVVVIDTKGGTDPVWNGYTPVAELPAAFGSERDGGGPHGLLYRLVVDPADARRQVRRALDQVRTEAHAVLVVDDLRSVVEGEQIGARSALERVILETRSSGVTALLGSQDASWLPTSVKSQPAVLWIARQRNLKVARELADLSGWGKGLAGPITQIPPRSWIVTDAWDSEPIIGMTSAA